MNNKIGNRKYFKTIKKLQDENNLESNIFNSSNLNQLNKNFRFYLRTIFDIIESKLYITNTEYTNFIDQEPIDTLLLDKETTYLEDEGILDWVKDSRSTQIVPSPFHSYGKSSIFITPIFFSDEFIGYYISLSRSSRLEFDDRRMNSYIEVINKFCLKLELFVKNLVSNYYKNQFELMANKLNQLPALINCKTVINSTSLNIEESIRILKSNINLLEKDSNMYFTRLKKITSEIDTISNLNSSLKSNLESNDDPKKLEPIVSDILDLLNHKLNETEIIINKNDLDNITINENLSIIYNSIFNILDYLISSDKPLNLLSIIGKKLRDSISITFFLGLEHYHINNINIPGDMKEVKIPSDLTLTNYSLESIGSSLSIKYSNEFGYLIKIRIK
ncbi:MAG: hypothetical protein ACE364_01295 [Chlorobiota bacterium]